jgi:hypothetical protein
VDAEHADSAQLGNSDDNDEVMYDDGSDEFENESDEDEYETVLYKPWAALDEEEQDAALNLGVLVTYSQRFCSDATTPTSDAKQQVCAMCPTALRLGGSNMAGEHTFMCVWNATDCAVCATIFSNLYPVTLA